MTTKRRVTWIVAAVCLIALPMLAQGRRRGYTPAGGWHRKNTPPVATTTRKRVSKPTPVPRTTPPAH